MAAHLLIALMLCADADSGVLLKDGTGQVWTIRSDPPESLGGGMASKTVHHIWRGDREVKTVEDFSSRQRNPTMSSSTEWRFRISPSGLFEAECRRSSTRDHKPLESSVTVLRWNGSELEIAR